MCVRVIRADRNGVTPLMEANRNGNPLCVQRLCQAAAHVDEADPEGNTGPPCLACVTAAPCPHRSPLLCVCHRPHACRSADHRGPARPLPVRHCAAAVSGDGEPEEPPPHDRVPHFLSPRGRCCPLPLGPPRPRLQRSACGAAVSQARLCDSWCWRARTDTSRWKALCLRTAGTS